MSDPVICRCGRQRCSTDDILRWRTEFPDGKPHKDPPWAAAICWSNGSVESCARIHINKETKLP